MDDAAIQPHGKNLRKVCVSLTNHAYLVTIVTAFRTPVFISFAAALVAVRCFHDKDVVRRAQTLAFVIMPEHALSEVVRLYKAKSSSILQRRVWQRGFHDHALREDEDLRGIARYIIANPLRSGLAKSIGDYPHWDAVWL